MKKHRGSIIAAGILFILAYIIYVVTYWTKSTFGIGLEEIIFTMTSPLDGADSGVVMSALKFCVPKILAVIVLCAMAVFLAKKVDVPDFLNINILKKSISLNTRKAVRNSLLVASCICLLFSTVYVEHQFAVIQYFKNKLSYTKIYDEHYVDPANMNFKLKDENGGYKNLIYIYLESMETTYTSRENGGAQDICYIPNLSKLANENITFSHSEKLGGFHNIVNTGFTMGALLGATSGIPFCFPTGYNDMDKVEKFAPGLTNLGDILDTFGYNQEFLCGSDGNFAGRKNYFEQHGNYEVFDYFTAIEKGYIPEDYFVFWGYEDKYLYEIAKDEALRLSQGSEPFNLTMLTVDTHHVEGYVCSLCGSEYNTQTKNVVSCADRQIAEFIDWCKKQDFYDDTVIIISGDHPRMDTEMVDGVDYYDRTIYNCFINCELDEGIKTTDRCFSVLDMFPTTLQALGFEWGSNRLGFGTGMFSPGQTITEELGYDYVNTELSKRSQYCTKFYK